MRFLKKGKLNPRYVGPYYIFEQVGSVSYVLRLTNKLAMIYPVFHVSMLKKCIGCPIFILFIEGLGVMDEFSYE